MAADRECMFDSHGAGKASTLLLNIKNIIWLLAHAHLFSVLFKYYLYTIIVFINILFNYLGLVFISVLSFLFIFVYYFIKKMFSHI